MVVLQYIVGILVFLSMIYSVYHCCTNKELNRNQKLVYTVVIIILPVIGMIIYFRLDQKKIYYKRMNALQNAKKENKRIKNESNTRKNAGLAPIRHRAGKTRKK